jgi:beta-galactosidase
MVGLALPVISFAQSSAPVPLNLVTVDASAPIAPPETGYLHMGGTSPTGHTLEVNSRYLVLDGKPWLPVMGEIHYTRVPEAEWEDEILKMKAGGINIISTYIFWIHHEEVEGQFDWTGRRDLRHFIELCAKHGMYVYLRPGPWAHGEVRNGGFPDWLVKVPHNRTNDPVYLNYVARFYGEIGKQIRGLLWKDGGPIIGSQLENEYGQNGPGRGAEHIAKLKELAIAAGIDPPLFSVTGWPTLNFPPHEVLPVSGGYPDGFWYTSKANLPPSITYMFNFHRERGDMGANLKNENPDGKVDLRHDPYFAAEEAGGMAIAYHRRPLMDADDIAAVTLTGIGSGVNLYGYYMFHGGANPTGKLTTLQESRATNYPNDLTQITYDFQAPLGEFGQERESYRKTRMIHLFLNAYGAQLAPMPAFAPSAVPKDPTDNTVPRVSVRSDGSSGFVFVNNYVRQLAMPERKQFQVSVKLPGGAILVPDQPIDIPANTYFFWPVNLKIGAATLRYSTAQPLTKLDTPQGLVSVFFAPTGMLAEFVFEPANLKEISVPGTKVEGRKDGWRVTVVPGRNTTIELTDNQGKKSTILVLTQAQAEQCGLLHFRNRDYLALTSSSVFLDNDKLHLRSTQSPRQEIALLPALALSDPAKPTHVGLWTSYTLAQPERHLSLTSTVVRKAAARPEMKLEAPSPGKKGPAFPQLPDDASFQTAAEWSLKTGPVDMHGLSELLLQVDYAGDIAHLSSNGTLLDDNFYNGAAWQIGLKRFGPTAFTAPLTLDILPMPANPPIYLDERAKAALAAHQPSPQLIKATLIPEYETILTLQ